MLRYDALLFIVGVANTSAFLPTSFKARTLNNVGGEKVWTSLSAKSAAKKKKKTSNAKGGGFGKATTVRTPKKIIDENDDYAAYPALEAGVIETLVSSTDKSEKDDLSQEMYDRIAQIYGFINFNYPEGWFDESNDRGKDSESMSFGDLLSASGKSGSKPAPSDVGDLLKPSAPDREFSDLIASATGGGITNNESTEAGIKESSLNLRNLPPFSKFRVLHVDPMVVVIDDFFTAEECDKYVDLCAQPKKRTTSNDMPMQIRSKTVGKDSLAMAQRTSTTWYHHFKSVPELVAKASRLIGLDSINRWEEPQTVRYQQTEKFTWHLDALSPSETFTESGGQRAATLLVYLSDIGEDHGGSTVFRDLGGEEKYLKVKPKKGSALLFFPSACGLSDAPFDIRTLHAGEALSKDAPDDKWIAQMWLRQTASYKPTAPPGNSHADATDAINEFCAL
jgi:hypothetical protein